MQMVQDKSVHVKKNVCANSIIFVSTLCFKKDRITKMYRMYHFNRPNYEAELIIYRKSFQNIVNIR